jgi:hypothetical protein
MMFDRCRDKVIARRQDAKESEIIAFSPTGGEDNLGRTAVQQSGDSLAGTVDGGAGMLALLVNRAGVPVMLEVEGTHGLKDLRKQRRGRVRVHVDSLHRVILLPIREVPLFGMNVVSGSKGF